MMLIVFFNIGIFLIKMIVYKISLLFKINKLLMELYII